MTNNYPEQRISVSKKLNSDWYKYNADYWINIATSCNNKSETVSNLNAANANIDSSTYDYVLKPLGNTLNEEDLKKLPGEIRKIDFITPIKEKNIGEYIELPYNYLVKLNDPDISALKNFEIAKIVSGIVDQEVAKAVQNIQQQGEGQIDPGQLEAKIKDATAKYFDDRGAKVGNLIEYINDLNDFDNERIQGFYYWWATEEVYFAPFMQNGNVYYNLINPAEAYPVLSGAAFVEDGDAFLTIQQKSLTQYLSDYANDLDKKDLEYLTALNNNLSIGEGSYNMPVEVYKTIYGKNFVDSNDRSYADNESYNFSTSLFKEYTIYFKTSVRKKLITKINPVGQLIEQQEEDDYELNTEEGDIKEEYIWPDEVWKQVRIGEKNVGIYLPPTASEIQIYDGRGRVKLPIIGKKGLLKDIAINPIPKRIAPSMVFYWIINLHIERQLAKYKSAVEVIPKGLLTSMDGSIKDNWFYKTADSTIIYDETKFSPNDLRNGYQIVGNPGIGSYIRDLIDLRDRVKAEAWDLANMNDSRYGQAAPSATVRNNEQNLYRAKLGSLLMVTMYNNVLAKLHNYTAELAKIAYSEGMNGSIIDKKQNTTKYFNIKSGELSNMDMGIFVTNSILEKQKLDEYKEIARASAQSGETDLAAESINADSSSEIRKYIKEFNDRRRQREEEMAGQEQASNERIAEMNQQTEQMKVENRLKEIEVEQGLITERELKLAEIKSRNINNQN